MRTIDPRIEERGLWWTFHKHLIVEIFGWLRDRLGDEYLVDFESQLLLDEFEQDAIYIRRRDQPDTADPFGSRVVSIIELLSPANKGLTGSADRRKFLAKRHDYLASSVSYTEIDLLEGGKRDLPRPVERLEAYPYLVWASQLQVDLRHHWGWGWGQDDPLPAITLPLDYPHIHTLDLGQCYDDAYVGNRWLLRLQDAGVRE